ncbi:hypothetical protein ABQD61_07185 [Enterococcus asini]|uniref:hypothetical protein n=1 Tax=Enterococcus asini TaxID=57732 RepID=UPI0032E4D607
MHITMEPVIKSVTQTCSDQEVAVSLSQCSALVSACQSFGVEGYRVVDYTTNGFLSRYLPIRIPHAPMLVYRGQYLIPLVFRRGTGCEELWNQASRREAFFLLLDWYLRYEPETIVTKYRLMDDEEGRFRLKILDSAWLAFRLQELIHCGCYQLKDCPSKEHFIQWNQESRLIQSPLIGRHSPVLDLENRKTVAECLLFFQILQLFFPDAPLCHELQLEKVG